MSQDNVETLRRSFEHWNNGNEELALDMLDPEVEVHSPFASVAGEPYRGIAGIRQWLADVTDQFEEWEVRADEIRTLSDDRLLVFGSIHVRGRQSGIELDRQTAWLYDFREGRILRMTIYWNHAEALNAVGLAQ